MAATSSGDSGGACDVNAVDRMGRSPLDVAPGAGAGAGTGRGSTVREVLVLNPTS